MATFFYRVGIQMKGMAEFVKFQRFYPCFFLCQSWQGYICAVMYKGRQTMKESTAFAASGWYNGRTFKKG